MAKKLGSVYVVTTDAGLNGRLAPVDGEPKRKRPEGYRLRIVETRVVKGRVWGRTPASKTFPHGLWYCLAYTRKFTTRRSVGLRGLASPTPGVGVGYPFGVRNARYAAGRHTGDDHPAPAGSPTVWMSATPGVVVRADNGGAYGRWVIVRSKFEGKTCEYLFAHHSRRHVKVGQRLTAGTRIGSVGSTGMVTGPHLHHEQSTGSRWAYNRVRKPNWDR